MARFVLVHGAWHGGWVWHPVARLLREQGHEVHVPTLPGVGSSAVPDGGLTACQNALGNYLQRHQLEGVNLVAHSWGGMVAAGAVAAHTERLAGAVFLSAFVPLPGESLVDLLPPEQVEMSAEMASTSPEGTMMLPFELFQASFMQDAPVEQQRLIYSLLWPHPLSQVTEKSDHRPLDEVRLPMVFLRAEDDKLLPEGEWDWVPRFPDRLREPEVGTVPGSHECMLTRPAEVAAALLKHAR